MSGPELVVFGCLTLDSIVAADGTLMPQRSGGNALYTALGARVWSDHVGVVSHYGAGYPEAAVDMLRTLGVDTAGVRRRDAEHRRVVAFAYAPDGSRTRAFPPELRARIPEADRARFTDSSLLPDADASWKAFAPGPADVPDAWWRTVRGIHCAFMPVLRHREIAAEVRKQPGPAIWLQVDSPWSDAVDPATDHVTPLLRDLDALLPSEADAEAFAPGVPAADTALALCGRGTRFVVLKLGSAGCRVYEPAHGLMAEVPVVDVPVVDPTGAGDAFCAGFLAGMLASGDPVAAARHGTVSASFAVEANGLDGLRRATRGEAADRLATLSS